MIPVFQTRRSGKNHDPPGNCFAACLASILEVPLEDVPDWMDAIEAMKPTHNNPPSATESWIHHYLQCSKWLKNRFGLGFLNVPIDKPTLNNHEALCILSAKSSLMPGLFHAVVGKGSGEIIHDPATGGEGFGELITATYLVLLDPPKEKKK